MPVGDDFQLAPNHTRGQFEYYLDKSVARPSEALAKDGYELLFSRSGFEGSLDFLPRNDVSFWVRRRNRKQTREELTRLINESFGKTGVRASGGWRSEESIGHQIMRECAPQGFFSITKVDEQAMKKIAARVHALRQEMRMGGSLVEQRTDHDGAKTYVFSRDDLRTIFSRVKDNAQELADLNVSATGNHPPDFCNTNGQNPIQGPPAPDVQNPSAQAQLEEVSKPRLNAVADADPGAKEFALYKAYRKNLDGRFSAKAAQWLLRAFAQGNKKAARTLQDIDRHGTYDQHFIIRELYRNGLVCGASDSAYINHWFPGPDRYGFRQAMIEIGQCLEKRGNPSDLKKAADYYLRAIKFSLPLEPGSVPPGLPELERLASEDDADLHYKIGKVYEKWRNNADINMERALNHLERAARQIIIAEIEGRLEAQADLHQLAQSEDPSLQFACFKVYYHGANGVEADHDAAARYLILAAKTGSPEARTFLAQLAQSWDPELQFALYSAYRQGSNGVEPDTEEAANWLARAAENGDMRAQTRLIELYLQQEGYAGQPRNPERAAYWLVRLAQTDPMAQERLDRISLDGPTDLQLAIARAYNECPAPRKDAAAIGQFTNSIWRAYDRGLAAGRALRDQGTSNDLSEHEIAKALEAAMQKRLDQINPQRNVDQQLSLARAYREGLDRGSNETPDDQEANQAIAAATEAYARKQAAIWFGHAAHRGDASAQYAYAMAIRRGRVESQQGDLPYLIWMSRAAEQDDAEAQYEMARFFQTRQDTALGRTAYAEWRARAIAWGHEAAAKLPEPAEAFVSPAPQNDPSAPDWWPISLRLIKDERNRCAALAGIDASRRDPALDQDVAALSAILMAPSPSPGSVAAAAITTDGAAAENEPNQTLLRPKGDTFALAQEALEILNDAYQSLETNSTLDTNQLATFLPVRAALEDHVQFLGHLADAETTNAIKADRAPTIEDNGGGLDSDDMVQASDQASPARSAIAQRRQDLTQMIRLLTGAYALVTDLHNYRRDNDAQAEDPAADLAARAKQRGLAPTQ